VKVVHPRELRQRFGGAVHEVSRAVALPNLPVHGEGESDVLQRAHVPGPKHAEVGTDGAERAEALAFVELRLRNLDVARRVVVDDHGAGHEVVEVGVGHRGRRGDLTPEYEPELDLVVEEPYAARTDDVAVGG